MAFVIRDRVKVTSVTTGTGDFTLGSAETGFQDFSCIGNGNQTYYTIVNGAEREVGIGTYTGFLLPKLSRDIVISSSNSNALVNFSAGTKEVFVVQPAASIDGTFPTLNDSSITTNNIGWSNFQKLLYKSLSGGAAFTKVFTAKEYIASNGYWGGAVTSMNGDIYLVPNFVGNGLGVKISPNGTSSTYTLVGNTSGGYVGGVLSSNGDIHFVPNVASVGQKISASGTVSTYALISTSSYYGGVMSPNGDMHFIPSGANVGQKISTAGAVSTYSLAYTTSSAYRGGVLAPNGDVHFIPYSAAVGQKISAAGTVSTYSLIYTTSIGAYSGGVISPNGDIHFVPSKAAVGQKISLSGTVSTYSLVYTLVSGAFAGGVLAPNGDVHFVPLASTVGQRVSAFGVVSTYAMPVTSPALADNYFGGVVDVDGNLIFSPYDHNYWTKVYTCSGKPFNLSTVLSSFLNKF